MFKRLLHLAVLFLTPMAVFGQRTTLPPSGTGSGACVGANCFLLQNYPGYFGDTREVIDATWAGGGSNVVTFPNSDGPVTGDSGKLCWAMPSGNPQTGPSTPGTLTVTTTKTAATCTASAIIGSASGNGTFEWGHDDTAAAVAATAALYTQPKCGSLVLPAARVMIAQGVSYTGTVAGDCAVNIIGAGYSSTVVIEPGFNFSTVTNNVGCISLGCFWNTTASTAYLYFTINATNQSFGGGPTGGPASALFTIGPGSYSIGLNFFNGFTALNSGNPPKAVNISGTGPFGIGTAVTNFGDSTIWCSGAYCLGENDGGSGSTFRTQGNGLSFDYGGTYGSMYTTGNGPAILHAFGSSGAANSGGFGAMSCDHQGGEQVFLRDSVAGLGNPGSNGIGFMFNNTGSGAQCTLDAEGTVFNGGSTGSAISSQAGGLGLFVDRGNNTFNGPMNFSGTYTNLTSLNVQGACTGTVTAASTLGLYGTGPNVTLTTCTSTTVGSGIVMNKAYTIYELLANAGTGGVNASSGAVVVLKNGSAQTMTCTIGTGTSCQDGAVAHRITGIAGDLISLRFTTQTADSLANVRATLVID